MLSLKEIRKNPEGVRQKLLKRMDSVSFDELLEWDKSKRELTGKCDSLKNRKKSLSNVIQTMKKRGEDSSAVFAEIRTISEAIKHSDSMIADYDRKIHNFLSSLPNIPDDDVVPGGKENNRVIREYGTKPVFDFPPADHVDIADGLNLVDYKGGVKLGGSGFWIYTGDGALLEWALLNYFIESHTRNGYRFILPPHILTYECGYTAGQFPKFEEDVFQIGSDKKSPCENGNNDDEDTVGMDRMGKFLLPSAETALVNLHRDEILTEDALPLKYFSYTPCYRKEAGGYRTNERGMLRGHQFNKVEMFQYTLPEDSSSAFDELVDDAEQLVQGLGLHYRVSKLAAKDCAGGMARTYDIEVWIPSINDYKEVSSVSNARDYQARRGNIRYKENCTGKNSFVHTLNGSGLATSRLIPAIVEQFQNSDGSVSVPEPLQKWLGKERLRQPPAVQEI